MSRPRQVGPRRSRTAPSPLTWSKNPPCNCTDNHLATAKMAAKGTDFIWRASSTLPTDPEMPGKAPGGPLEPSKRLRQLWGVFALQPRFWGILSRFRICKHLNSNLEGMQRSRPCSDRSTVRQSRSGDSRPPLVRSWPTLCPMLRGSTAVPLRGPIHVMSSRPPGHDVRVSPTPRAALTLFLGLRLAVTRSGQRRSTLVTALGLPPAGRRCEAPQRLNIYKKRGILPDCERLLLLGATSPPTHRLWRRVEGLAVYTARRTSRRP